MMGRKPEDTGLPAMPQKLFTLKREEGPNGFTLTAIWTGLTTADCRMLAEGCEALVKFPEEADPREDWDGGGACHDIN